jgi:hypothetical protein
VRKKAGGISANPVTPDFLLKNMVSNFRFTWYAAYASDTPAVLIR